MSTTEGPRVRALRGATTIDADDAGEIVAATSELLEQLMARNAVPVEDVVSILFTATDDVTAEFPAAAARGVGLGGIPLMCAREMRVAGSVPGCIRVMMHFYTERATEDLQHVYLRGATALRADLVEE